MDNTKKLGLFVGKASREQVVEGFKYLKFNYIAREKIITKNNILIKDTLKALDKHCDRNDTFTLPYDEVRNYLAASALSHLLDGWGYLSNSITALFNGNKGAAIHLAYYSELRGAMSLLASEGIGVFSKNHIALMDDARLIHFTRYRRTTAGRIDENKLGTHPFVWSALEKWCKSSIKPDYTILDIFSVKGHNFTDLIAGFHPQATLLLSTSITKKWPLKWALDISKFKHDHNLRDFASYRPQSMYDFKKTIDIKSTIKDIYSCLSILSPLANNNFNYLDIILLKNLYTELFELLNLGNFATIDELISNSFTEVGDTYDISTRAIMMDTSQHIIFAQSSSRKPEPLPVIARAILLLRLSTGLVSSLLKDANIQKSDLQFIWNQYGFNSGLWDNSMAIKDFYTLWVDVEDECSDMIEQLDQKENNPFLIKSEFASKLNKLSQFNRAVLWGL